MTAITEELRPWAPDGLEGRDPRGLSYVVVDEIEGGAVGLAVSEWPRVDAEGRLRFATPPALLGADRRSLEQLVDRYREASRPLRIGDVFAARTRPVEEGEARLEPMLEPAGWIDGPVYDITADARDAAKASFYAAVTPTLAPAQVAQLGDLVERPQSPPPSGSPPTTPPVRPPRPPWQTLAQILAGAALFGGGIGAGVGVASAGGGEHTVTLPGGLTTVPSMVDHTTTITVIKQVTNGETGTSTVTSPAEQVEVPKVVGLLEADANGVLDGVHLRGVQSAQVASEEPKGTVVAQAPDPGTKVAQDSTVSLTLSSGPQTSSTTSTTGPELESVPTEIGKQFKVAIVDLKRAGFGFERTNADSDERQGTVVDQNPAPESLEPAGTTVELLVSNGPATKTTTVPDVKGLDSGTAQETLIAAGLGPSVTSQPTSDPAEDGIVLSQNPEAGSTVDDGSTVTIVVGQLEQTG